MAYYPDLQVVKRASPVIDRERGKIEQRKPYKFPKQYINYQTFLELIVVSQIAKKLPTEFDRTTSLYYAQSSLWDNHHISVYGISEDTLALFQQSKIDTNKDLFEALPQSQRTQYCVLLPSGSFTTYGDEYIEVLWIESIRNNDPNPQVLDLELDRGKIGIQINGNSQRIVVSAIDTNEQTFCVASDYPAVAKEISNIDEEGDLSDRNLQIITDLKYLALQIVMSIEFLPEAIGIPAATEAINKGFGKKSPSANYWQIRQITIEQKRYIVKQKSGDVSDESTRNSPRPHWRKWHWRRVVVGTERKGREWRLIPNTFVNPEE
jgi:hypothetical protein